MIDIHSHLGNYEYFPKYFIDGIVDSMFYNLRKEEQNLAYRRVIERVAKLMLSDNEGKKQLEQAKEAGITKSVLLIVDFLYDKSDDMKFIEKIHSDHRAVLEKKPDKWSVFAGIDPRRKNGMDLLEKSIKEYNFSGLKLYPPCGFELDDKQVFPYYEFCQKNEIPVLTHTGPSLGNMKISNRLVESVENVVKEFKSLNLILAHAGILYHNDAIELSKHEHLYVDISGFEKEINNIELLEYKFKRLFSNMPERVLFGTDWPLFNFSIKQKDWIRRLESLRALTDKEKEMLFEKNAMALLKQ